MGRTKLSGLSAAQRRLSDQMHTVSGRAQQLDTGPGGVRQIHFDRRHQVDFWRSMG